MKFKYKGFSKDQEIVSGEINCKNKEEALLYLQNREILPIKITQVFFSFNSRVFSEHELSNFSRECYFLLSGGLSLTDTFKLLKDQARKKKHVLFYQDCLDQLYLGENLSAIFKKWKLPDLFISSFEVAENSGLLLEMFKELGEYYQQQSDIKKAFTNAISYPVLLIIVMIGMVQFLSIHVLPIFEELFIQRQVILPWQTKVLLFLARGIRNYSVTFLLIFLGLILVFYLALKNENFKYRVDYLAYHFPLFSKIKQHQLTMHLSRNLYLLLQGGQDILTAFAIMEKSTSNLYLKDVYSQIQKELVAGRDLWHSLAQQKIFLPTFPALVRVGEEAGSLKETFNHSSLLYQNDFLNLCKKLNTLIEPVLLILLSVVVAFIIISIISPMFEMINQF